MADAWPEFENRRYFEQIEWCKPYLDDPLFAPTSGITQRYMNGPRANTLFTKTLKGSSSILATTSFIKRANAEGRIVETATLIALGTDLNGHHDTLQGGMAAVILDRCAGVLMGLNDKSHPPERMYTAYLNVSYRKPVTTPQVVVGKAYLSSSEGRKDKVHIELLDKDKVLLSEADAMFIRERPREKI